MSYYPKQYPVLEKTHWEFDARDQFKAGTFEDAVLADLGPQVAPGKQSGAYLTPLIDAGQAVAWTMLHWEADLRLGASISLRTRSGSSEEVCLSARWSEACGSSPCEARLSASVAAARFLQVRVDMTTGTGGSPTLQRIVLEAGLVPPACVGPMNLGIVEDGKPIFYWTRVEGAAAYSLELCATPDFAKDVFRQGSIPDPTFAHPRQLKPGAYWWRVRAFDGTGRPTEFSPARRFTVGERPHDTSGLRHPYLFFTRDELPGIKKRLLSKHAETWRQILDRAEKALEAEVPDEKDVLLTPGQHGDFHPLARDVARGRLESLAFAYLISGEEKYAAKAREVMLRLVGFSRWTGVPFGDPNCFYPIWQAALETAGMCKGVATTYDWLYDYLSEDDRITIRAGLLRLGLLPIIENWADPKAICHVPRHQLPAGNWWSVCNSGGGIAALAMINEVPDASKWVPMVADAVRSYLIYPGGDVYNADLKAGWGGQSLLGTYPNWGEDGGYVESLGYVDYGLTNAMYFIDALKRVTGEDLASFVYAKLIDQPYYFINREPDGGCSTVNFNDSGGNSLSDDLYALLAKHLRCTRAKYLLSISYPSLKGIHAVLAEDETVKAEQPDLAQRNKLFRDIGWTAFRSGWDEGASLMAAKFTHGRGHLDIGQFVIRYKGSPFVIDPGIVDYASPIYQEHLRKSFAHNVVLVDGQCQTRADGRILGFAERPGIGIVEADLTAAYNDLLTSWRRTLIYLEPESFIVIDRLASDQERTFSWLAHPSGRFVVQPGMGATIYQDNHEMQLRLVSPGSWRAVTKQGYIGSTPTEYLSFEPHAPCREALFCVVFCGTERGRNVGLERKTTDGSLSVRLITPDASHAVFIRGSGEAEMTGWDISATASTCAVTQIKGEGPGSSRWVLAGAGPLKIGDWVAAEQSSEGDHRAGTLGV